MDLGGIHGLLVLFFVGVGAIKVGDFEDDKGERKKKMKCVCCNVGCACACQGQPLQS